MTTEAVTAGSQPSNENGRFFARHFPTLVRCIGALGWPILLRQLRADFRRHRFFLVHLSSLTALGLVLIFLMSVEVEERSKTPSQIGENLFSWFFMVQTLICILVFPAFSATAFSEEYSNQSMDMLLTTTMRPIEIVWGKLLSSAIYCFMYIIGSVPILSVVFLFGGVPPSSVFAAFSFLASATLFISMLGVCVSSWCRGVVHSTLTTYGILAVLLIAGYLVVVGDPVTMWNSDTKLSDHLLAALQSDSSGGVFSKMAVWGGLGLVAYVFLFLVSCNRIRPSSDNGSTSMRWLALLAAVGCLGGLGWATLRSAAQAMSSGTGVEGTTTSLVVYTALLLFLAALAFSTEDPNVSRKNQRYFSNYRGLRFPWRLFAPGSFWGCLFTTLLSVLVCALLLGMGAWVLRENLFEHWEGRRLLQALTTLPICIAAASSFGFLLASYDFTPKYSRLTLFFTFVIVLLLPLIFYLRATPDAIWTLYYLSPITLWGSLTEDRSRDEDVTFELGGIPVIHIAKLLYGAVALVCFTWACWRARRSGYPLLRFYRRRVEEPPVHDVPTDASYANEG